MNEIPKQFLSTNEDDKKRTKNDKKYFGICFCLLSEAADVH